MAIAEMSEADISEAKRFAALITFVKKSGRYFQPPPSGDYVELLLISVDMAIATSYGVMAETSKTK